MTRVSYGSMDQRELRVLYKQWVRGRGKLVTCEAGHEGCGCSTEDALNGQAPCGREVLHELAWRGLIVADEVAV